MDPKNLDHGPDGQKTPDTLSAQTTDLADHAEIPLVAWESLDQGKGHLQIAFHGQIYHLRVTRNGKLILTK
jgi:hemin uptake protein HemP